MKFILAATLYESSEFWLLIFSHVSPACSLARPRSIFVYECAIKFDFIAAHFVVV